MLLFAKSDVERGPSIVRVEYGGKPVARAYPEYYTRNLAPLYQRKITILCRASASAAALPVGAPPGPENAIFLENLAP